MLPQESLQHFRLHSCLKMRTEDQLHCVSSTNPFRGTIPVLEVVTPNPLVSRKKSQLKVSLSSVLYRSGVLGSPWIFFIRPRRLQGFTDKGEITWPGSLSLFEWHRQWKELIQEESSIFALCLIRKSKLQSGYVSGKSQRKSQLERSVSWLVDWSVGNCMFTKRWSHPAPGY